MVCSVVLVSIEGFLTAVNVQELRWATVYVCRHDTIWWVAAVDSGLLAISYPDAIDHHAPFPLPVRRHLVLQAAEMESQLGCTGSTYIDRCKRLVYNHLPDCTKVVQQKSEKSDLTYRAPVLGVLFS